MVSFLSNPISLFLIFFVAIIVIPIFISHWSSTRRAEIDAELKLRMLEMGLSAEEIERILNAKSDTK